MIIGTIALLTFLFGGGLGEVFFIDSLEKGVKEYVVDKERRKEILADLDNSSTYIKEFNKARKSELIKFELINNSRSSTNKDMQDFFSEIMKERISFQDSIVSQRIRVVYKINDDEWTSIIKLSERSFKESQEKIKKKEAKSEPEVYFQKTRKEIENNVNDSITQNILNSALNDILFTFEKLANRLNSINVEESNVLVKKDAVHADFEDIADKMNKIRADGFNNIIRFHFLLKDISSEASFDKIIKAYSNDILLSPR